ncbi:MAG: radical SAM protein [Clostridiales bacterium]|nr:radical SAM protein [Clostridiales bacterium]
MVDLSTAVLVYTKDTPQMFLNKYPDAEKILTDKWPDTRFLGARGDRPLILALPNESLKEATELCVNEGFKEIYVVPLKIGYQAEPIGIDTTKPRLDNVEIELVRVCNLNCRGCADFIQLAGDEAPFYDIKAFERDLLQLKRFYWGVEKIRLMGGEPLLSPRIAEYVEISRDIFPDADLRIVTNGLLIPSLSDDTLERLRKCGCSFDISNYPPTKKRRKEIAGTLRKSGITYDFSVPMRYFMKNILLHPTNDPKPAFDNCIFTHCHMLGEGGLLAPCSLAYCIPRFNRKFGTSYPETDVIDLYNTELDGKKINEMFSSPHLFCACCGQGLMPFRWRAGVNAELSKQSDWLIPDGFLTQKLIPIVQRTVKPFAVKLRSIIQRKK